jgi:acyl-CoA thioester hydrolase
MSANAMDKSNFKHRTRLRVRNYEVDWQGIVHNAVYLQYFEVGRIEYLKNLNVALDAQAIQGQNKVVLVRNEIDYKVPAHFDDLLTVYTRVASIRNSSFVMEGMLERDADGRVIAENVAVHVWLDAATDRPRTVGEGFRKLIQSYEGERCQISWPSYEV